MLVFRIDASAKNGFHRLAGSVYFASLLRKHVDIRFCINRDKTVAKFLRENFSQGTKVCMEIASMCVDAGYIKDIEKDIICIGGTGRGADTVCLINPAPTSMFDTLRVKAILAKPQ